MNNKQKAFTLIEVMIVIAIIGILASIALPTYSNYQSNSKMIAGLLEITNAKKEFEILSSQGVDISSIDDLKTVISTTTNNCIITATPNTVTCKVIQAPSLVLGAIITWTRNTTTGEWTCNSSNIIGDSSLAPKSCPQT